VGIDHDTAQFAPEAVYRWWKKMGRKRDPDATGLLITADGGGSNGSRCRLWKVALQDLADRLQADSPCWAAFSLTERTTGWKAPPSSCPDDWNVAEVFQPPDR